MLGMMRILRSRSGGWGLLAMGASVLVSVAIWLVPSRAGSSSVVYEFTDIAVAYATDPQTDLVDTHHARVEYRAAWASGVFPGQRRCTWRVLGPGGEVVGETSGTFRSRSQEPTRAEVRLSITGVPQSAEVQCESGRLDDPAGTFSFTRIRPKLMPIPQGGIDPHRIRLVLDGNWMGEGVPAPQECDVIVHSTDGDTILSTEFGLATNNRELQGLEVPLHLGSDLKETPASATLDCRPFG